MFTILALNHLLLLNGNNLRFGIVLAYILLKKIKMKKLKFLLLCCILSFAVSCGQQKRYVSYKVKEGETLQSIAKQYNLNAKDLVRLNPDVGSTLSPNSTIIIPNPKNSGTQIADNTQVEDNPKSTDEVVTTKDDTTVINNDETPSTDSEIDIEELKKNFVIHIAKPKETVYRLTKFYNVTKEELFTLNPTLEKEGLKIGQVVKIKPIKTEEDAKENDIFTDNITSGESIKLVMLLPFRANEYDSISSKDLYKDNKLANIVTDFYMGAEIAIDSIKKQGVNVDFKLFDTGKKGSNINTILSNDSLDDADVIIGPLYFEEVKKVARGVKSPVIFPVFSKKQQQFSSSKVVKTAPDKSEYLDALSNYLFDSYNGENIIVVGDGKSASNAKVNKLVSNLKKHDSISKVTVLKPTKGYIKKEFFTATMQPKSHTWTIIISDNDVVVADALNSMIALPEETTGQVFAIEKTKAFDRIDNYKLAQINFGFVTSEFIDETDYTTKQFNKKYKAKNFTLPSNYATKGFDITYDVLARLASSEKDLKETFSQGTSYRVVSKFDYDKSIFGATDNNGLFVVKYNEDLSIKRLR